MLVLKNRKHLLVKRYLVRGDLLKKEFVKFGPDKNDDSISGAVRQFEYRLDFWRNGFTATTSGCCELKKRNREADLEATYSFSSTVPAISAIIFMSLLS